MKKNEGFVSLISLFVILIFIIAIFLGLQNIFFSNYVLDYKNRQLQNDKEVVHTIIEDILGEMQNFVKTEKDYKDSEYYQNMFYQFSKYDLTIRDISSALNLNFITHEDLQNTKIQNILFASNMREDFIKYRETVHYFHDFEEVHNYLNSDYKDIYTLYGWINPLVGSSYGFEKLQKKYGASVQKDYFPLVNKLPQMNIHFMNEELLKIIISDKKYKIPNVQVKFKNLIFMLEKGESFTQDELAYFFEISKNNALFLKIGTKTTFWQINFSYKGFFVSLVVAGIPKDKNSSIIDSYILLDRRILFENKYTGV